MIVGNEDRICGVFAKNIFTRTLGDTIFWGHFIDHKHTISSKMPQKQFIGSDKQLTELESSEKIFCVITRELQNGVMEDNTSIYNETCGTSEKNRMHSESIDPLTKTFKESFVYQERKFTTTSTTLLKKLNQPIEPAESMPAKNAASSETACSRILSACYEDQVHGDPILEHQECRTKVHLNVVENNATQRGNQIIGSKSFFFCKSNEKMIYQRSQFHLLSSADSWFSLFYLNCTCVFQFPYQVMDILPWYAEYLTVLEQIWFVKEFSAWLCTLIVRCAEG